jgi:hypothetical protein
MKNFTDNQAKAWWGGKTPRLQTELMHSFPIPFSEAWFKPRNNHKEEMELTDIAIISLYQWYLGKEKSELDCILLSLDKQHAEPTMSSFVTEIVSDMNDADVAYYDGKESHCHQALEKAKRKIEAAIEWNKRFGL